MKVIVHLTERDKGFFETVDGFMEGGIFGPFQCISCLDYVLRIQIDLMLDNFMSQKSQEADDIPQKPLQMKITQMI